MPVASILDWEQRRAMLCHDSLKNGVMPTVFKMLRVVSGSVSDPEFGDAHVHGMRSRIDALCADLVDLAADAPSALSPRHYLDEWPLSGADDDTRKWLAALVHQTWLNRAAVEFRIAALKESIQRVRERSGALAETPSRIGTKESRELLQALHTLSQLLSSATMLAPYRR